MSPKFIENLMEHIQPRDASTRSAIRTVASSLAAGIVLTLFSVAWAARSDVSISKIETMDGPDSTIVKVHTSARPVFTVFKLERPPRLVLTLNNARIREAPLTVTEAASVVRQIATTQFKTSVRMVIFLQRDCPFFVQSMGTSLLVTLSKGDGQPMALSPRSVAKVKTIKQPKASLVRIKDIRLVNRQKKFQIKILLDGQAIHRVRQDSGHPVLELEGVQLPRLLQRTFESSDLKGPITQIKTYTSQTRRGRAYIKVALKSPVTSNSLQAIGRTLIWEFQTAGGGGVDTEARPALSESLGIQSFEPSKVAGTRKKRTKRYKGRRIDLDFKDADIHNILRLLSDVGNVNIITSDSVKGQVTIRMKNIPWDQALDVILRAKGLGQVREGNLIRVALITDLAKEREAELARMKQVALLKPLETRLIPLSYAQAGKILAKLKYTISPRGKLTYDERTNMVIARDIAGNLDLMERLIHNLDTQTPQVLIEARIVEARSNFTREIGVQWGGNLTASPATGNPTGLVFPNQIGLGGGSTDGETPTGGMLLGSASNPNFAVNLPATAGTGSGGALGLTLGSISGNVNINLRLSAAESMGNIRIVSSPRITTLDNIEATIEQGVSIPFSQVSANGVQTVFKDAKLQLKVKPHVTADGSVIMKVDLTRDEPDTLNTGGGDQPGILTKSAKTVMLVKDGDTAVIGGIYTTRSGRSVQKVPWFADIPILGFFFKYNRELADREEVLVFITPRIINRAQSIGR